MHNFQVVFNSLQSDGSERPYVRVIAADTHANARAFARSMVGEPISHTEVLLGVEGVYQTEQAPRMGSSMMTNLEVWSRALRSLQIPPERCIPVYSFHIGLPHNARDAVNRLVTEIHEPEIVGFTFRFTRQRYVPTQDPARWRYPNQPLKDEP